ncbi:hypothetical protein, partial [Pseudomonas viridiflava]|uniref:hypothetical protein n=1 Tax=Pseudomonas viridiflava TaxID=33069 RepID=UPI0019CFD540
SSLPEPALTPPMNPRKKYYGHCRHQRRVARFQCGLEVGRAAANFVSDLITTPMILQSSEQDII